MHNDPFSKLGAIDQKLFQQPASPQTGLPANQQTRKPTNPQDGKPANPIAGKPENPQARIPVMEQVEKYTTRLEPSLVKRIKIFAAEHDLADYEVVKHAVEEYLARKK